MHDSRNRFLLFVVAILALVFSPVTLVQGQSTAQDQDQPQQRVRDQILLEDPDVEIAHNDRLDENDNVTHDDRVVVDTVFSNGPGWLVVYAGSGVGNQGQDGFWTANQCGVAAGDLDLNGDDQDLDDDSDLVDDDDKNDADDDDLDVVDDDDQDLAGDDQDMATNNDQALVGLGVVGYAHLMNGVNRGIEVRVDASRATQTLCLQLHRDAGEIGVFEFPAPDRPVSAGLLINVTGGLLDEQGQLVPQEDLGQD